MHRTTLHRPTVAVALLATGGLLAGTLSGGAAVADNVNTGPTSVLTGAGSGLATPAGIAHGANGALYTANYGANSITVHAAGASGAAAPIRTVQGPSTLLANPFGIDVDANGYVYVSNFGGNRITVYAPGANGNAAPVKTIAGPSTGLTLLRGLSVDPGGTILATAGPSIREFGPSATGDATPDRVITGAATTLGSPWSATRETDGDIVAADLDNSAVVTFAPDADGAAPPTSRIAGAATGLVTPIDVDQDSAGRLYVSDRNGRRVSVFPEDGVGNIAPLRTVSGVATGLSQPYGLDVLADRRITVCDVSSSRVATFAPLFPKAAPKPPVKAKAPSKVRSLRVSGKVRSKKRVVRWTAPSSTGGARITGYRITVTHAGDPVLTRTVSAGARKATLTRSRLVRGRNRIVVRAINKAGTGAAAVRTIRVRK